MGLSATPSEQELKRAYLRQVKAHPPERDADGFRQVREAYELLKQATWVRQVVAAGPPAAPPVAHEPSPALAPERPEPPERPQPSEPESPEENEPGPSFPEHIAGEIEALNKALAADDPAGAAAAMIALYGRPLLEEAPVPPPIFALKTFMVLMERGRSNGSGAGSDVAARWKLAREVLATSELDERLARDATVVSTGKIATFTIERAPGRLSKAELSETRSRLERLKFHPRAALPNATALTRAEALYVELTGPERALLGSSISHFRAALESQDSALIVSLREALLARLLDLNQGARR